MGWQSDYQSVDIPVPHPKPVDAQSNNFMGRVTRQLFLLTDLTAFHLYTNSLTGSLPTEAGKLGEMRDYFQIYANKFTGALPSQLGRCVCRCSAPLI